MIVKLALAGALALGLLPLPDSEFPPTIFTHHPYVEKVSCDKASGTAFKIADGRWLTVAHVADNAGCRIDGKPITILEMDPDGDFAIIDVPDNRKGGIEVNCNGYSNYQWYWGMGHGRGYREPQIVAARYDAWLTWIGSKKWGIMQGNRFVPGMSGGPVLDQTGRVVGLVNAYGIYQRISFSRQLRDTSICAR
jgi:hypothetical protein